MRLNKLILPQKQRKGRLSSEQVGGTERSFMYHLPGPPCISLHNHEVYIRREEVGLGAGGVLVLVLSSYLLP